MISKKYILIALAFMFSLQGFSQTDAQIKYDKERYEKKSKEIKAQLISDIVEALKVDDFKQHIITLSIESYFVEITKIYMYDLRAFEKEDLVTELDKRHFNDIKTILDQEQIDFILNQIKGDWKKDQKDKKKKKKKKNDRKKDN
ncbi:hypothetical protein [Psychroserpens jangbogonensis]|uniref:hypothetical protein n=1 Tax=Psychroserpens jangbogonensis TaxID=1484460 RepID=UPI00053D6AC3|nr:hypothetical protein [Psychroserpens jangbogonensis]